MATVKVNCAVQVNPNSLTVSLAPFRRETNESEPTIVWEAGNDTTFPSSNFFAWKSGGPGFNPTRSSDGKSLTLTYEAQSEATWTYEIALVNDGVTVSIDPEIHNDPPP